MKKHILSAVLLGLACFTALAANYKVTVPFEDEEGATAVLVNFDTGEPVDSVKVTETGAVFQGVVDEPMAVRLVLDGAKLSSFILEEGDIQVNPATRSITGGWLNQINNDINAQMSEIGAKFQSAQTEAEQDEIYSEYVKLMDSMLHENLNNPIGYLLFLDMAYEMAPAELEKFVEENPYFKKFVRVNKLIEANRNKLATSEGQMFADFEIEYDGVKHRLSDVVGKGDYVLVDFWASWCGPCIRQTAVLKDIYKEYKDKGLKILGVAVWDEPENTKKAIEQHELPWESWLNGQNVPTDVYGISGIPCIILFGPDGNILSRDKQDAALKADVAKYVK